MRESEQLQVLIDELNQQFERIKYTLIYNQREQDTEGGRVYPGYYLLEKIEGVSDPKPGDWNFNEFINGQRLGENYKQAEVKLEIMLGKKYKLQNLF